MIDTPEQVARNICASAGAYESDAEDLRHWTEVIAARDADIRRSTLLEAFEKLEILAGSPLGDGVTEAALRMGADRLRQLLPAAPAAERSDP